MGAPTDTRIRNLKPREKAYQVADGNGLVIDVRPVSHQAWLYRYRLYGKQEKFSIGSYPASTTCAARPPPICMKQAFRLT